MSRSSFAPFAARRVAIAQLLGRSWPRRLRHQMLLMLSLIVMATMVLLYEVSSQRLALVACDATQHWAESVARTAASAGSASLALRDYATLETTLRDIASLPGVLRIDVTDPDSAPLLSLLNAPNGRVSATYRSADMQVPRTGEPRTRSLRVGQVEALQVWSAVGHGGDLGSVGVTFALDAERASLERLRFDAVGAIAVVGLLTVVSVHLLLLKALAPLQRLANFSRGLAEHHGATLQQEGGSREVAELTEAVNHASTTLHSQMVALQQTEERTQAILNAVPDAILGLDSSGHIHMASPAAASVFGHDPQSAQLPPLAQWLPELDAAAIEDRTQAGLYMRASRMRIARFETTARRQDGTEFPADVSLSRVESEHGPRYACVVRDVTEQRMTFSMLNLYRRALECTSNGVVISDMNLPGQPVFYANPAFGRITGYEVDEAIGRNCSFLQRGDTAQPELQQLRHAVEQGQSCCVVLRNYRKDGSLFFNELSVAPVDGGDGRVAHYVGVLNDVTERERARMAIAERNARLNAVFDLSPDGFVVFDRDGQMVYTNRAFQAMTGWRPVGESHTISMNEFDTQFGWLCDPAQDVRSLAQALDAADDQADTLSLVLPERRVLTRVVRRQSEGLGETIVYLHDVTRETEVDRMKSEFLTTAAHELRTPMVSVFGFTELLLNRPVPENRRRDMLQTIHRQASLLISMVNELLDLARIEARQGKDLKREPCRLSALVEQATVPFASQEGAPRLRVTVSHADAWLWVDPEKTHRVFTNVLSNAFKYSPEGGDIEVTTLDGSLRGAPAVGVCVRDHGIGMSPDQLRRVFERFYRADPSGNIPGTGLGMSLVKEITELQGGQVDIASQPGVGTEVTLWWPVAAPQAVAGPALQV